MLYYILFTNMYTTFESRVIAFFTFCLATIFALTIHEFAHSFTAHKLGDPTPKSFGRLTLNPLAHFDYIGLFCFLMFGFGWAKPVPINPFNFKKVKRDTFLVSISGILVNLICAFICYPLFVLCCMSVWGNGFVFTLQQILVSLFNFAFQANLVFMVFNLLPIHPLDGYNAISAFLPYENKFSAFMQKYGSLVLLFVIILFNRTNIFEYLVNYVGYPIMAFWGLFF